MKPDATSALGRFATRHALAITFIAVALCLAGVLSALRMPSSVFPQTDFPRVVILVDNGIMPADEMMATVTRPIEEAMKDIPGAVTRALGHQARLGADQRVLQLARGHGAVGVVCAGPALADQQRPAANRQHRGRARDVLGVSHHRHQPDQSDPRPHGSVGDGQLRISSRASCRSPAWRRWNSSAATAPEYHVIVDPLKLQAAGPRPAGRDARAGEEQPHRARRHAGGELSPLPDDGGWARPFAGGHRERGDCRPQRAIRSASGTWRASSAARSRRSPWSPPRAATPCCSTSSASPTAARWTSPTP